ncbi:MAG: D-alanyl-D-alanine carboxypeptidase [Rhodospirillaceae bacterium]|nr:D-alanyl-D-alanine carboxypeptidase [Rhodospirillaceae bacterium]
MIVNRFLFLLTILVLSVCFLFTSLIVAAEAKYASIVIDAKTGEILQEINANDHNYPASLTKMMTLYMVFDALDHGKIKLTDRMPVSVYASTQVPSKLGLRPKQTITVEDAILSICTKSANDSAVVVGEFLGGNESEFAKMITHKAHDLGMHHTVFRNASGLHNVSQISSAHDMAILARALLYNHPHQYHYFSTMKFNYNGKIMHTHNHLMEWYDGVDGIKTGYVSASGFNLVASVKRNGKRLIGVIFGCQSATARDRHMARLLDDAFNSHFGLYTIENHVASKQKDKNEVIYQNFKIKKPKKQIFKKAMMKNNDITAEKTAISLRVKHNYNSTIYKSKKIKNTRIITNSDHTNNINKDHWEIQVGSYFQKNNAEKSVIIAKQKLKKIFTNGKIKIVKDDDGRSSLYRARIIGLSEQIARKSCRNLDKNGISCIVFNSG